ncbi:MAG: hypothetical protein HLUCCA08_14845 [Rhodobacteraceae bacterium HLUCCA08]|nr:MAG: hypothetical protein HLUCCA08_14845 [Rhodobacteraceae bacterium HLUCCA08]
MTDNTVLTSVAIDAGSALEAAVKGRANILALTRAAENAVLRPRDPGPWSHALRAALAARIAGLNGAADLAARHAAEAGDFAALVHPDADGAAQGLAAVVAFMDKVAMATRDVTADDIAGLQAAGVADADIVRLAELNAFLSYQIRVIAGLRLIGKAS